MKKCKSVSDTMISSDDTSHGKASVNRGDITMINSGSKTKNVGGDDVIVTDTNNKTQCRSQ
jgi:hypothetical protein